MANVEAESDTFIQISDHLHCTFCCGEKFRHVWSVIVDGEADVIGFYLLVNTFQRFSRSDTFFSIHLIRNAYNCSCANALGISKGVIDLLISGHVDRTNTIPHDP